MRVIDLTLPLDEHTPVYEDYRAEPWATLANHGYSVHRLELGSHTGTHLDAPAHFVSAGPTLDEIPLARLVGRAGDFMIVAPLRLVGLDGSPCRVLAIRDQQF
jgi:kynurenine formamidase